jgi:hypothetical protein
VNFYEQWVKSDSLEKRIVSHCKYIYKHATEIQDDREKWLQLYRFDSKSYIHWSKNYRKEREAAERSQGQQTLEEVRARRNNDESLNKSPSPSPSPQRNADQGSPIGGNVKPDPDEERRKEMTEFRGQLMQMEGLIGKLYQTVQAKFSGAAAQQDVSFMSEDNTSRMSASSLTMAYKASPVAQLFSPSSESM